MKTLPIILFSTTLLFSSLCAVANDDIEKLADAIKESVKDRKERNKQLLELYHTAAIKQMEEDNPKDAEKLYSKAYKYASSLKYSMTKDRIKEQRKEAAAMATINRKIDAAREKLKAEPGNQEAINDLILYLYAEKDDFEGAQKYAEKSEDLMVKTCFALMSMPSSEVPPADYLELCKWLSGLADQASKSGQISLLRKAADYYQDAIDSGKLKESELSAAKEGLSKTDNELDKLGYVKPGLIETGKWVSMLNYFNRTWPLSKGEFSIKDDILIMARNEESRNSFTVFPVHPLNDYKFRVGLMGVSSAPYMVITLPVGQAHQISFGMNSREAGFGDLDGVNWSHGRRNPTNFTFPKSLRGKYLYKMEIEVKHDGDDAEISVSMSGRTFIRWKGSITHLDRARGIPVIHMNNRSGMVYCKDPELYITSGTGISRTVDADRRYAEKNIPVINTRQYHYVQAAIPWTLLGRVEKGKKYKMDNRGGTWYHQFGMQYGNGLEGNKDGKYHLQGRIGDGKPFAIKDDQVVEASASGPLYVGMSHCSANEYHDNCGSVRINVTPVNPEEEETPVWHRRSVSLLGSEKWKTAGTIKKGEYYRLWLEKPRGKSDWHFFGGEDPISINIGRESTGKYRVEARIDGGKPFILYPDYTMLVPENGGKLEVGINKINPKILGKCSFSIQKYDMVQLVNDHISHTANRYYYQIRKMIKAKKEKEAGSEGKKKRGKTKK